MKSPSLASPAVQKDFLRTAEPRTSTTLDGVPGLLSASLRTPDGVLAPMTYETARTWAYQHACRLPTRLEALAMARLPHIPVQSIAYNDPDFGTLEGARRYTERVDYQTRVLCERVAAPVEARMRAAGISTAYVETPVVVDNESKVWIRDAAAGLPSPGYALLVGFFDERGTPANSGTGAPGKKGYGPKGEPHNSQHVDYSMAPRFVVVPHETKRVELVTLAHALTTSAGHRMPTTREAADYFRLGTREGKRTGYSQGWDWCAAGACWLGAEVGLGLGVHDWRITVWELIADARASGRFSDVATFPAGEIGAPLVGDLLCFRRAGDPRKPGELGHVETYIGGGRTLSANSPGWLIKSGRLASPDYVGYVAR